MLARKSLVLILKAFFNIHSRNTISTYKKEKSSFLKKNTILIKRDKLKYFLRHTDCVGIKKEFTASSADPPSQW